jgi:hypothetical protein
VSELFDEVEFDIAKLRDYCQSESHPRGRHKARLFRSRLGLSQDDAEQLQALLVEAVMADAALLIPTQADRFGQRFNLDVEIRGAIVRSAWILSPAARVLRFVTCYVL